jgi:transposase
MEPRQPYPTDLTDHEWALIEPYVPHAKRGGGPEHYPKREILNGIFDIVHGGCAWRLLRSNRCNGPSGVRICCCKCG